MKRLYSTAGTLLLVCLLVILSVWAFNKAFVLENLPGDGNGKAILFYRILQFGILGLIVVVLGVVGFFYRKERKGGGATGPGEAPVRPRVIGWKAWAAILLVLGVVFGGAMVFFSGDTYFKMAEPVYAVRDQAGNVIFKGTFEEVQRFMSRRQGPRGPASGQGSF